MSLFSVFQRSPQRAAAEALYRVIINQARKPSFYTDAGVPDTPDGRFDLIAAHTVLVLRRLHRSPEQTRDFAQVLFDLMFADMDQNLREMGVGDLAVGKRVKAMAQGFYGRLAAYDQALSDRDVAALRAALRRNLFRNSEPEAEQVAAVAGYLQREAKRLDDAPLTELSAGRWCFGCAPGLDPRRRVKDQDDA
jgi:cytochrome b pre-mRNA-processing protein 3